VDSLSRTTVQWALVIALALVAIVYFMTPGRAESVCERWTAEVWEEEGGSVLTAAACAREAPDAWLSLTCFAGTIAIRYDLAYGAERSPDLDETRNVVLAVGDGSEVVPMEHEAMDGLFAGTVPADGTLVAMLADGAELSVRDTDSFYPLRAYSLAGSRDAIAAIRNGC
jgi:hypothetical protein